jgi:hypothetical protein
MKSLLISLALLCAPLCVLSQGVVAFRNDNLSSPPNRLIYGPDMTTPLTGTTFAAQLLYGTGPASLQPHPTLAYFRAPTTSSPGTWSGGNRTLTGVGGVDTTICLQVRFWDSGPNRTITFDQARATGGLWGESAVFPYTQRQSSPPDPVNDTAMINFQTGIVCVPELATSLLLFPGIAVVWLLKRRTRHSGVGP